MTTIIDLSQLGSRGFTMAGDRDLRLEYAGVSVSNAGDINGDGIDDMIVGAPLSSQGGLRSGGAYVIFGRTGARGTVDFNHLSPADGFLIEGNKKEDSTGNSVSEAGDFNGDGYADMILGALDAAPGGRAYIVFGGPDAGPLDLAHLKPTTGIIVTGAGGRAGETVSYAGDINGDGIDDVIVSAPFTDDGGEVYVLFGRAERTKQIDLAHLSPADGIVIHGAGAGRELGRGATTAGDVNGDGLTDLILGAPGGYGDTTGPAGTVYVVFGKTGGVGDIDLSQLTAADGVAIHGEVAGDHFGFSVGGAGDVNGDGFADMIVGAPGTGGDRIVGQKAYVIFGHAHGFGDVDLAHLSAKDGFVMTGAPSSTTGGSVAGAGDVNGDGFADVIVGANLADGTVGRAYVIYGKAGGFGPIDLTNLADADGFVIQGKTDRDQVGIEVSAAGDVNGDGFADVIVGSRTEEAYVIYGVAPTGDVTRIGSDAGQTIRGGVGNDTLDGRSGDDMLFGAQGNDRLLGSDGNDVLSGDDGDDDLNGGNGKDQLIGGDGSDILHGGDAADQLFGNAGDDAIYGGEGRDRLSGGAGADRFHFSLGGTAPDAKHADLIADFSQTEHDLIDLSDYDADPGTPGDQPFHFVGTVAFSGAGGEVRYERIGRDTFVSGDVDGDKAADFTIRLHGGFTLTDADFLLVAPLAQSVAGYAFSAHADITANPLLHLV